MKLDIVSNKMFVINFKRHTFKHVIQDTLSEPFIFVQYKLNTGNLDSRSSLSFVFHRHMCTWLPRSHCVWTLIVH